MDITTNKAEAFKALPETTKFVEFDLTVSYDCDIAQMWLQDFKDEIADYSVMNRDGDYIVIGDLSKPKFLKSHLSKMKKLELFELCEKLDKIGWNADVSMYTRSELIELALEITLEHFYKNEIDCISWRDLDFTFVARGNCQGDAIKILLVGDLTEIGLHNYSEQYIANLYFDQPLYARLEVMLNGECVNEFYFDEYLDDLYNYDKAEMVAIAEKYISESEYRHLALEYLSENLPEYPELD